MSRREWAACLGVGAGFAVARCAAMAWLARATGWAELLAGEPKTARYVAALLVLPLPFVAAIFACAFVNFSEVHGLVRPQREPRRHLPAYPFDSHRTQLVIGETHHQDGARAEQPGWLVLP